MCLAALNSAQVYAKRQRRRGDGEGGAMMSPGLLNSPSSSIVHSLCSSSRSPFYVRAFPGGVLSSPGLQKDGSTIAWRHLSHRSLAFSEGQEEKGETSGERKSQGTYEVSKYVMLSSVMSTYDDMSILKAPETSTSRYAGSSLLVNSSGNILSVYKQDCIWTDLYFDEFASLPPIVPEGPIAILGLGGGTAARILQDLWPSRMLEGWEIDQILVDKARVYFGLADLETPTAEGGVLSVHVGDALSPEATIASGFAGIVVDLFSKGEVLPQLKQPDTWHELKQG